MAKSEPGSISEMLELWHRRIRESQWAHYEAVKPLVRANYMLGVPVAILSSVVGTSLFATLQAQTGPAFRLKIGLVSVAAAILASLQTFLRFGERAEKHRGAAARYGCLRRDIEVMLANGEPFDGPKLDLLKEKVDSLSTDAPEIPPRVWKKTESLLRQRQKPGKAKGHEAKQGND